MSNIRRVTLYKHGLGFFEQVHPIEGDAEVRLDFRPGEMNDLLKSLTVHDPKGVVLSVSYDSDKPVHQLLQDIALELPQQGGGAALLARLRGAEVVARTASGEVRGSVVGLESRPRQLGDKTVVSESWLTLWTAGGRLVNLNLAETQSVELLDEALRTDLGYALEVVFKTNKRETKQLSIFTRGQGSRELQISYLTEAPAWKSSYRILLPDEPGAAPFWEGWALVDNPRDEDWDEVELTLVAGLPVSFRHDLYTPRFVERPEVEVQREATVQPMVIGGAVPELAKKVSAPAMALSARAYRGGGGDYDDGALELSLDEAPSFGFTPPSVAKERAAQVMAQSVGEMFHYKLRHPVTVKRNGSALVPLVGQEASGGKVLLYNAAERRTNPFAAVELTNTTGLTLEGGPLLVIEGGSYAGEAMLDTLKPDDRRIVPYAVDLAVRAECEHHHRHDQVHQVSVAGGVLSMRSDEVVSTTYLFAQSEARAKVLWLEHPLRHGWELHDTAAETERSATCYRWRLELPASGRLEWSVKLRQPLEHSVSLADLDSDSLSFYRRGGYFTPTAERIVERVPGLFRQRDRARHELERAEERKEAAQQEIERCCKVLPSLSNSTQEAQLRAEYVSAIQASEQVLKTVRAEVERLETELASREDEISDALSDMSFEKTL